MVRRSATSVAILSYADARYCLVRRLLPTTLMPFISALAATKHANDSSDEHESSGRPSHSKKGNAGVCLYTDGLSIPLDDVYDLAHDSRDSGCSYTAGYERNLYIRQHSRLSIRHMDDIRKQ